MKISPATIIRLDTIRCRGEFLVAGNDRTQIKIRNRDHEIDILFLISESELFAKPDVIHAIEERAVAQSALVTDIYWPEEFSMLKDRFANLDELDYEENSLDHWNSDRLLLTMRLTKEITSSWLYLS